MATIIVMVMVLFVLGNLMLVGALANTALSALESQVDITVYFVEGAVENDMLVVKKELESLADVREVAYVSKDKALELFREKHKGNALIFDALEELGENPLQASLNIRAQDPSDYAAVSNFLLNKNYPVVDKINYFENQLVIDRLGAIFSTVRGTGALLGLFLAFVAILVAFNTIRLAIYTMREEIGIMRLVGGSSWFIRGPFLVNGVLYGVVSAAVTMLIFFPLVWLLTPKVLLLVPDFNLFRYYLTSFFPFFAILLVAGISLGVISSFIAMRRYLRI